MHGDEAALLADFKTWRPGFGYGHPYPGPVDPSLSAPFGTAGVPPPYGLHAAGAPRVDLIETERAYEVMAELPGLEAEDVEILLEDNALTIRGEKRGERRGGGGYYLAERSFGAFHRTITLPAAVDAAGVEARFRSGVLSVRLPKAEPSGSADAAAAAGRKTAAPAADPDRHGPEAVREIGAAATTRAEPSAAAIVRRGDPRALTAVLDALRGEADAAHGVKHAKASFSALFERARNAPQRIERRDGAAALLVDVGQLRAALEALGLVEDTDLIAAFRSVRPQGGARRLRPPPEGRADAPPPLGPRRHDVSRG